MIEIFGLGYVGFPLLVRLSSAGYRVRGIDVNEDRIKRLKDDILHDSELLLRERFLENKAGNRLELTGRPLPSDLPKIGIICVPTPVPDSSVDSNVYVNSAIREFLKTAKRGDLIIIESSIKIGTTDAIRGIIDGRGFCTGRDFGLAFCPERIDPQNKKWNLENIPRIIYCSDDSTFAAAGKIYNHVNNSNLIRVSSPLVAEAVKSFENAFRLVNISLVNELAILCDHLRISVSEVIDAASTKPFGFMPFYPGAGAGGHCIPKDPIFLLESFQKFGSEFTTIRNALSINSLMPEYIGDSIIRILEENNLPRRVLICGMAYKPDIEDMRDSPGFKILEYLLGRGSDCSIYDPYLNPGLLDKYLAENHMTHTTFGIAGSLDDAEIGSFSCICIAQHHSKTKFRLDEIYKNSSIPVIYDCQNKLTPMAESKTLLTFLGGYAGNHPL